MNVVRYDGIVCVIIINFSPNSKIGIIRNLNESCYTDVIHWYFISVFFFSNIFFKNYQMIDIMLSLL